MQLTSSSTQRASKHRNGCFHCKSRAQAERTCIVSRMLQEVPKPTWAPWSTDSPISSSYTVPMPPRASTRSSSTRNARSTSLVDSSGLCWEARRTQSQSGHRHRSGTWPGSTTSYAIWYSTVAARAGGWTPLPRGIRSFIRILCTSTGYAQSFRGGRISNCAGAAGCCVARLVGCFLLLSFLLD